MTDTAPFTVLPVAELAEAVAALDTLDDIDRIAAARKLAVSLPQHLAAHADEWTWETSRTTTQQTMAMRLGVSKSQIERAITRHLHRMRSRKQGA